MFKNAKIYGISFDISQIAPNFEPFEPCAATQQKSVGWVPPRGHDNGQMYVPFPGLGMIVKLMIETKSVPAQSIKDAVAKECERIEELTGRKPGKKERRELADNAMQALLPVAFPKRVAILGWIDLSAGRLIIDTASQSRSDDFVSALLKTREGIKIWPINTVTTPAHLMAAWLHDGGADDDQFTIGRACVLEACDESKAKVRYTSHPLDTDEVKQHIESGKVPSRLDLTWKGRVSFTLTDSGDIAKINMLDVVFENSSSKSDVAEDGFDTDVVIFTGEMRAMLPDLFAHLGGVVEVE